MLAMTFVYLLGPFICFLINILITMGNKKALLTNLYLFAVFAVLTYVKTYFMLPSRNLLSVMCGFWGLVYETIALGLFIDSNGKAGQVAKVLTGAFLAMLLIGWAGEIHSTMSVKPVWNSI